MNQGFSRVAAFGLLVAMAAATIGTIVRVDHDPEKPACLTEVCWLGSQPEASPEPEPWKAQLADAMCRTQRGFLQMAGHTQLR